MSGHRVPIKDTSSATIEPAPKVWVEVNGQGVLCPMNKPTQVGGVTVKVTGIVRGLERPTEGPPYYYVIEYTTENKHGGNVKTKTMEVRSMDEGNAKRLFWEQVDSLLEGFYVTIKSVKIRQ